MDATAGHLRGLPQVQRLLETPEAASLLARWPRGAVTTALREVLAEARVALLDRRGTAAAPRTADLLAYARVALEARGRPVLGRVVNATGIVLHTNLGRAPLADEAVAAMAEVARGYSNLEFDLGAGARGSRTQGVEPLLRALTGAEAALAVNNNAAAMLLALSALAAGGEVVVSRGELVEIGGGFRIPDVIRQGGARLVEVGTTNRTRLADYADAIGPATRILLKVHQSNYRIVGFTAAVPLAELAALARGHGLLLVEDLGSGTLADMRRGGHQPEPTVGDSVRAGADLVAFSGDKLLGGPQAGLLVGRSVAIDPLRRHPLLRALRLDKLTLAALEATLRLHRDGASARIPVLRMLAQGVPELRARAQQLCDILDGRVETLIEDTTGFAGGGSLPGAGIASIGVALLAPGLSAEALAGRLRAHRPAVVGRVVAGCVLLDMLTVADADLADIADAVRRAIAA